MSAQLHRPRHRDVAFKTLADALRALDDTEHNPPTHASDSGFNSWMAEIGRRNRAVVAAARAYLRSGA